MSGPMPLVLSDLRDRIQNGEFENVLPYPSGEVFDNDPAFVALVEEKDQLQKRLQHITVTQNSLKSTMRREYNDESSLRCTNFRAALEKEYELQNHPKKEKIWQKAWDDGHSGGWTDILNIYDELVDLVL